MYPVKYIISAFLVFFFISAASQSGREIDKLSEYTIKPTKVFSDTSIRISYKEIIVRDFRFDTTKYGYIKHNGLKKIVAEKNSSSFLSTELSNYFAKNLDPSSKNKLYIIIKKLKLTGNMPPREDFKKITKVYKHGNLFNIGVCIAEIDIFSSSSNGNLKALAKIEDVFSYNHYSTNNIWNLLTQPFDSLFNYLKKTDTEILLAKKKSHTKEFVDSVYTSRFDIPILKSEENKRGIFLTFEDFRNKKISYPGFFEEVGSHSVKLYTDDSKVKERIPDCWGYHDGKDYYLYWSGNSFRLQKQNNTWDFFGLPYYIQAPQKITNLLTELIFYSETFPTNPFDPYKLKKEKTQYQIDMITGEIY